MGLPLVEMPTVFVRRARSLSNAVNIGNYICSKGCSLFWTRGTGEVGLPLSTVASAPVAPGSVLSIATGVLASGRRGKTRR